MHILAVAFVALLLLSSCEAWISPSASSVQRPHRQRTIGGENPTLRATRPSASQTTRLYNVFTDWISGGTLQAINSLPYDPPLCETTTNDVRTFAIQERAMSWTGEDFDVEELTTTTTTNGQTTTGRSSFCRVRGAMLRLPGKDKMRLYSTTTGQQQLLVAELDRKLVALTPTYDIYRAGGGDDNSSSNQKLGWIERKLIAFTDTFEVHLEGKGGFGPIKPPAAFYLEGDFLDRRFVMKTDKGQVVAKITKDGWIQFDAFNHYQVQVAPRMDPVLVIACACVIDEEFDEEHKERAEKRQREEAGGGVLWPF